MRIREGSLRGGAVIGSHDCLSSVLCVELPLRAARNVSGLQGERS